MSCQNYIFWVWTLFSVIKLSADKKIMLIPDPDQYLSDKQGLLQLPSTTNRKYFVPTVNNSRI